MELTARGKTFAGNKLPGSIYPGSSLSPQLFVILMIPLTYIIRKCNRDYKCTRSLEKINHLMYSIKLFAKNEKE